MYEELVKLLRNNAEHYMTVEGSAGLVHLLTDTADAIEELSREYESIAKSLNESVELVRKLQSPCWVSVTERLPEEDGWYQVYAPGYSGGSSSGLKNIKGNMYSAFKNGKWSIEVGYHKRPGCVKAWMPLPEPPKEEATT